MTGNFKEYSLINALIAAESSKVKVIKLKSLLQRNFSYKLLRAVNSATQGCQASNQKFIRVIFPFKSETEIFFPLISFTLKFENFCPI